MTGSLQNIWWAVLLCTVNMEMVEDYGVSRAEGGAQKM
jgi:hypothetical protein